MNNSVNVIVWAKKLSEAQNSTITSTVNSFKCFDQIQNGILELKKNHFDLVLIFLDDFKDFALSVLTDVKKENANIPIIVIVSSELQQFDFLQKGASTCITFEQFTPLVFKVLIGNSIKISELNRQVKDSKSQLKKLENRLSTIIGNTPMILFMLDLKGVFKLGLGKLWEQFKVDKQFVLGQNIGFVYQNYPEFINAFEKSVKGGVQKTVIHLNTIVFEIILTPVLDNKNEVKEILGVAHDITERAKGENSLIRAKKIAENTAKIKQEFIANMSHEIRTPMNAIVGFSGLLEETKLNNIQQDYVQSIKLSGENLLNLINSILDFSVIESGKISVNEEVFELSQVLNSIEKVLFISIKKKKILFEINLSSELPKELIGDPNLLNQVMVNLLSNAVKFTEKGKVCLNVNVLSRKKNELQMEFVVSDTGIGIPNVMLDKVFDSFTQVNPESNRKHGGTGLGLSIVKNIVQQLHGKISLQSELGKGTLFKVVIPFNTNESISTESSLPILPVDFSSQLKGLRILLAEDNTMNQKLVIMILKKFDVQIDLAETGIEALKAIKSNEYDMVLMDIQMPEMDGIEATKIIRNDFSEDKKNIPIIALTAHAFQEELDKCIEVGMNACVIKPIETNLFLKTIVANVQKSKQSLVMDISYLKDLSGDDEQMLKDIILTYQIEMPEIIHELNLALGKLDAKQLGRMAHKAKSSFKMLGMEVAFNALLDIEMSAKNNSFKGVSEMIYVVQNQFDMAMDKLMDTVLKQSKTL